MKKLVFSLALIAALGGVAAATGGMSWLDSKGLRGQERLVKSRIQGYWDARVQGDLEKQVEYLHPLQETIADTGMLVTEGYELKGLQVEGDTATAIVSVDSRLKHPIFSSRERSTELQTRWVRYDGKWYRDLAPASLTDAIKQHQGRWTPPTEQSIAGE